MVAAGIRIHITSLTPVLGVLSRPPPGALVVAWVYDVVELLLLLLLPLPFEVVGCCADVVGCVVGVSPALA